MEQDATPKKDCEILIVEDSPTQALKIRMLMEENGYPYRIADNGLDGLEEARKKKPDIIVSDVQMPKMDGFALCRSVKTDPDLKDVPVILLTTLKDPEDIISGLNAKADSYVTKPYEWRFLQSKIDYHLGKPVQVQNEKEILLDFTFKEKKRQILSTPEKLLTLLLSIYEDSILKNEELEQTKAELEQLNYTLEDKVEERTEELKKEVGERKAREKDLVENAKRLQRATRNTLQAMMTLMGLRDMQVTVHQMRVAKLAYAMAGKMGLSRKVQDSVRMGGAVHDIGQMAISLDILNAPRSLTDEEFAKVKIHPRAGHDVLQGVEFPWPLAEIVLQHHERLDGSGYPEGLTGEAISQETRIVAVADVAEAMVSNRPYRKALPVPEMLAFIRDNQGRLFDPDAVAAAAELFEKDGFDFDQ